MKKTLVSLSLLFFTLNFNVYGQTGIYDVNFKNMSMKEFVTFVSSFTQTGMVYNEQDLRGNVTIASQTPMKAADIMEIFYATLNANGLNAFKEKDYIRIVASKDINIYEDKFVDGRKVTPESFVTTILVLKNYNATALSSSLGRVRSNYGSVEPLRGVNAILIRDLGTRVDKMREVASYLDRTASSYMLYSVKLENVLASKMEQQVIKLFNELMKNSLTGHIPMMVSDDSSNILIVITDENSFKKIDYLVSQIDIKSPNSRQPRIYYLKYASSEDMEKVLNKLFSGNTQQPGMGLPSKFMVSSDKSTNSLIAYGDQDMYTNLEHMIDKLDIPRKQVYVEALILETSLDRGDTFGVEWFGAGGNKDNLGFADLKNRENLSNILSMEADGKGHPVQKLPGGFSAGFIGNVISFNGIKFPSLGAFLTALRTDAGVNIVSNPQILTLDNENAEVFVGENRPYLTSVKYDSNDRQIKSYDYKNVGIRLKISPHVTGDDTVILDIDQEINKVSGATFDNSAPVTQNRTTKTKVLLYDRSIMLISGLMKDDTVVVNSAVPLLSDIPLIGWLFKSTSTDHQKTNLMVFITAHIIHTREDMDNITEKRWKSTSSYNEQIGNMMSDDFIKESDFIKFENDFNHFRDDDNAGN